MQNGSLFASFIPKSRDKVNVNKQHDRKESSDRECERKNTNPTLKLDFFSLLMYMSLCLSSSDGHGRGINLRKYCEKMYEITLKMNGKIVRRNKKKYQQPQQQASSQDAKMRVARKQVKANQLMHKISRAPNETEV